MVYCNECDDHCHEAVEVRWETGETAPRAFVVCPRRDDLAPMPLPLACLQRWRVDLGALAEILADELDTEGSVDEGANGRLWWLGRATFRAGRLDVFMARRLAEEGGAEKIGSAPRFQQCSRAVVLALCDTPRDLFPGKVTASLPRLLSFHDRTIRLDVQVLGAEVARWLGSYARQVQRFPTPPGAVWEHVEIVILADGKDADINAGAGFKSLSMAEMGLAYPRTPAKQTESWKLLLRFADEESIGPDSRTWDDNLPKRVERLKRKLQELFGIDDDPFKPFLGERAYVPRFVVRRVRPKMR